MLLLLAVIPTSGQASRRATSKGLVRRGTPALGRRAKNGEIAFSRRVHGISQVFTVNPDGTRLRQATHSASPAGQFGLSWSPNGRGLLYSVTANIDTIFQSGANGSGATAISPPCTGTCLGDDDAVYSPDGKRIAFERAFGPVVNDRAAVVAIFTMNVDGSQLTQLTNKATPTSAEDHQPAWSPDGTKIAFVHSNTTATPRNFGAVEVMNADGSNVRRLTPFAIDAENPHWSPDGKRLLLNTDAEVHQKSANLFTMHVDGTHRTALTHYNGALQAFADGWSPDGRQIIFRRLEFTGTDTEVGGFYVMNLGNKRIRRLTPVRIRYDALSAWGRKPG
jgi:Tol biopolymer transport system component